jgi:mono/diheme cytochrome c family protein
MFMTRSTLAVLLLLSLAACGQNDGGDSDQKSQDSTQAPALDEGPRAAQTLKLDDQLAVRGASLFEEKTCSDCHALGEEDIGPDLLGALDRRTQQWLIWQLTRPEWMNENDAITQDLIEEYGLEMVDMGVTEAEAEAILHFLLRESEKESP